MLSKQEIARYQRQLLLPEIGMQGQQKLKQARVLVIGAGGLGCPVLLYLAAAGIGKIGIVDFDVVDESNLQRQILYDVSDIGQPKTTSAKAKILKQNPNVDITICNVRLTTENALDIFYNYDIIIDGTDNFATRYLVNDACFLLKKILISGSIFRFEGQVAVFNFTKENTPTYRCLFPSPPNQEQAPSCAEAGVIAVLPGIIGTLMANETIKLIVDIGKVLAGKLLVLNILNMDFHTLEFERNLGAINAIPKTEIDFKKMDYEYFCGSQTKNIFINEITFDQLFDLMQTDKNIQIIDVREKHEQPEIAASNVLKIPIKEIEKHVDEISKNKKVIVVCQSGIRSKQAIELLQNNYGFENLFNLTGGVTAWNLSTNKTK